MDNNISAKGHLKSKWLESVAITFAVLGTIWYLLSGIPTCSNPEEETQEEHSYVPCYDDNGVYGLDKTERH